ncbi:DUF3107 domain-containing protein [Pseudoclavibacter sp. VKM Ac-2867]|uniref:DUF3107 domain-containing protein n=1 Tax=Pseudoclavibacter sp. VKM Ac-2867 TaxID=2783829 RepID=UPI00188C963B|nr:DUF3107 domain-containing protein [Pseudoclavibacter sp. VKM Ac-2867]MBF4460420.1 DUF3107 domain-containing protein [Pseudoclavibacter sp. VKM Ac-2867]
MEVRIGIKHAPRELSFETDLTKDDFERIIEEAVAKDVAIVKLHDSKSRSYLVSTQSILYVELSGDQARRVGFIA